MSYHKLGNVCKKGCAPRRKPLANSPSSSLESPSDWSAGDNPSGTRGGFFFFSGLPYLVVVQLCKPLLPNLPPGFCPALAQASYSVIHGYLRLGGALDSSLRPNPGLGVRGLDAHLSCSWAAATGNLSETRPGSRAAVGY